MKNKTWKTSLTAMLLSAAMIQSSVPALAALAPEPAVSAPSSNYGLTDDIRAAIKNVSVIPTASGSQIAATVRLYNGGAAQNRVPEHELRVRTTGGVEYKLVPSANNKTALQPKEISELVYMATVESKEITGIDQLSFVHTDVYTYPKQETTLLSMPATSVWYGNNGTNQMVSLPWGQPFSIPGVNSDLVYTPAEVSKQSASAAPAASAEASKQSTAAGPVLLVTLLAENPSAGRQMIPSFRIDARSGQKTYEGKRSETDPVSLEAGEKAYIHFSIPVDQDAAMTDLLVVSTDAFISKTGNQEVPISTGKAAIAWPTADQMKSPAVSYTMGTPIPFDSLTKVIDKQTEVSLVELHLHENPESGYKTAIAKLKFTNNGSSPVSMPELQAELADSNSLTFTGVRQTNVSPTLEPGLSYIAAYSFHLPRSESGGQFQLKLLDPLTAAPYKTTVASIRTGAQQEEGGDTFSMYPYDITLNDYSVSYSTMAGNPITYTYKINVDMDIKQKENVVVDTNFPMLRFEIVDPAGRIVGTTDASFTGPKKLISGKQTINSNSIQSDEFSSPITVNMYEVITTPNGEAERLVKSFQQ
ncbi:hypothetical protein [Paenibacillus sp. 32352]|uniref:hypothetical protein n=1 Tax=Paenibacillus sp. 32352 TaxID=1969111 RepID=UPI0009AD8A03|nr:hypothetical protein [Paenibacillus sp. 32352]